LQELMEMDLIKLNKEYLRVKSIDDPRQQQQAASVMLAADYKLFKTANDHIEDYHSTLKELSDEEEANDHKVPLAEFTNKIKAMKESLRKIKEDAERELLVVTTNTASTVVTADDINDRAKARVKDAEAVQEQDIHAIARMNNLVNDTEEIGQNTKGALKDQGDKLTSIGVDLEEMREDIATSRQLIKAIQKELQKDKCWRVLLFLVLAIGLVIVIWAAVDPNFAKSGSKAGGDGLPSSTSRCQGCQSSIATRTPTT